MQLLHNVSLVEYNTFRIPCVARDFVEVKDEAVVIEVVQYIRDTQSPFLVLGGGSNILFTCETYDGVVVRNNIDFLRIISQSETEVYVEVGAGMVWDDFVQYCVSHDWYGVENLSLIPGTVGAAPVQNIGAYGVEVADHILSVKVYDIDTQSFRVLSPHECGSGYRESIFKKNKNLIIVSVTFSLGTAKKFILQYRGLDTLVSDLKLTSSNDLTLYDVRRRVIEIRESKLPNMRETPNAGSFFKNPVVSRSRANELRELYPTIPLYDTEDKGQVKVAAGWLIEHVANARALDDPKVGVWSQQALVLVNRGGATGTEVLLFAKRIQDIIKTKTGIELEMEVNRIDE